MSDNYSKRDADIIRHMIRYCSEIDAALAAFGDSEDAFLQNPVFAMRSACLCSRSGNWQNTFPKISLPPIPKCPGGR